MILPAFLISCNYPFNEAFTFIVNRFKNMVLLPVTLCFYSTNLLGVQMKNMKYIPLLIIAFMIFSCGRQGKKIVSIHPDGFYKEVYHVKDDSIKHGLYTKYYSSGMIADSCYFKDGKMEGLRYIYSNEGHLEITESYVNGNFEGPYKTFYPGGQVKKVQNYINNKIQGEVIQFHENGNRKAITQFVDNLENGPFNEFYENGNIHWEGFYEGGDYEQDSLIEYDPEGKIIRKLFCEKGICQTVWTPESGSIQPKKIFEQ